MKTDLTPGNTRPFLFLLFVINALNFFDRQILAAVTEPIKQEWALSDTQVGWLGTAFTLLYAVAGIPLGRLADTWNRTRLLGIGVALWSALTFTSGLCRSFAQLFAARLGVGIGEAVCAPAATSLIGDLYPPSRRARALSVFMLGLPAGLALSYAVSGTIAQHFGWRAAFFVAGVPGLFLALGTLMMREPRRSKSPEGLVFGALKTSAFWLIVVSGALHNFNMYALTYFLPAFLSRYHGATLQTAGFVSGVVIGLVGGAGMFTAGWMADRVFERRANWRLLVAASAILLSAPSVYFALERPRGALVPFMLFLGAACFLLYAYYGVVYAAIQDIVAPEFRGTAMAIYFLAMYLLGASLGPVALGWLSDYFAARSVLTPALALHKAMYVVPVTCVLLALVLFAAAARPSRTGLKACHCSDPTDQRSVARFGLERSAVRRTIRARQIGGPSHDSGSTDRRSVARFGLDRPGVRRTIRVRQTSGPSHDSGSTDQRSLAHHHASGLMLNQPLYSGAPE